MTRRWHISPVGYLLGAVLCLNSSQDLGYAQTAASADRTAVPTPSETSTPEGTSEPSSNMATFLMMPGRTQDRFQPLTQKERAAEYAKSLISPFYLFLAAASAGISQWEDVPPAWGQGAHGFGLRFGNYVAKGTIQRTLLWGGEAALHEDNRYFGSGYQGIWHRTRYALASSVLARHDDGKQYFSFSQIGSQAGAAFLSRTWQPGTDRSMAHGAVSFGIAMAANAGLDVVREFLPDMLRKVKLAK